MLCIYVRSQMKFSWQYLAVLLVNLFFVLKIGAASSADSNNPRVDGDSRLVVNTWTGDFSSATTRAWNVLRSKDGGVLDAVEQVRSAGICSSRCM